MYKALQGTRMMETSYLQRNRVQWNHLHTLLLVATQGTRRLVGFQGYLGPLQGRKVVAGKEMMIKNGMIKGGLNVM
jgi:predicted metal-dependent hydrolase